MHAETVKRRPSCASTATFQDMMQIEKSNWLLLEVGRPTKEEMSAPLLIAILRFLLKRSLTVLWSYCCGPFIPASRARLVGYGAPGDDDRDGGLCNN